MREQEIRDRINQYLKARMRGMLVPALGMSLLAVGCTEGSATAVYSAPMPDASQDQAARVIPDALPSRDAPAPDRASSMDAALPDAGLDAALPSEDAGNDALLGDVEDALPTSDAGRPDGRLPDASPDTKPGARPDAKPDVGRLDARRIDARNVDTGKPVDAMRIDGPIGVRYIAQQVDAALIAPLYLAQIPLP